MSNAAATTLCRKHPSTRFVRISLRYANTHTKRCTFFPHDRTQKTRINSKPNFFKPVGNRWETIWVIITVKGIVAVDGDDDTFWGERFLSRGSGSSWLGRAQCVRVLCCGCEGMWSLFASSVELPCFKRQIIKKDLFLIHKLG